MIIRARCLSCFCTTAATRVRKKKHNWDSIYLQGDSLVEGYSTVLLCLHCTPIDGLFFWWSDLNVFFQTFIANVTKAGYRKQTWGRFSSQNSFQSTFFSPAASHWTWQWSRYCLSTHRQRQEKAYCRELLKFSCTVSPPNPARGPMARKKIELPELPFLQSSQSVRKRSNIPYITDGERERPKVWWLHQDCVNCERSSASK